MPADSDQLPVPTLLIQIVDLIWPEAIRYERTAKAVDERRTSDIGRE